jgi:hypothetical protein
VTGQVQLWTGLPHGAVQLLFAGLVLHGLAGALLPTSPTYSDANIQVRRDLCALCAAAWPAGRCLPLALPRSLLRPTEAPPAPPAPPPARRTCSGAPLATWAS